VRVDYIQTKRLALFMSSEAPEIPVNRFTFGQMLTLA